MVVGGEGWTGKRNQSTNKINGGGRGRPPHTSTAVIKNVSGERYAPAALMTSQGNSGIRIPTLY